jgi:hypothetical protein
MSPRKSAVLFAALAAILLATFGNVPAASASPGVSIGIRVDAPPPPLRREVVVVRPGPGFLWVPGHWDWAPYRGNYVWVAGAWVRPPYRHAVWVGPVWHRRYGRSYFVRGHWRR